MFHPSACRHPGGFCKANDETDHNAHTYVRQESGLLAQLETEPGAASEPEFTIAQAREVLKEVERRFEAGMPFSHSPRGGARYLGLYLVQHAKMNRKASDKLVGDWLNNGVLTIEASNRKTKLSGVRVLQWL